VAKTRYAPDRGLTARMTLTMFLLGVVFVAFIIALVLILSATNRVSSGGIVFIAVLFGLALTVGSFWYSDKIALSTARAVVVGPQDNPRRARLHGIVDRLVALANMPKPRVAIAPSPMLNAFATGATPRPRCWSSRPACCAATWTTVSSRACWPTSCRTWPTRRRGDDHRLVPRHHRGPAGPLRLLLRAVRRGRPRPRRQQQQRRAIPVVLIVLVVGIVTYAVSFLLIPAAVPVPRAGGGPGRGAAHRAAVRARQRAAEGQRVDAGDPEQGPAHRRALNAFYFVPAFKAGGKGLSLNGLFSTHPSLDRRLRQLSEISDS